MNQTLRADADAIVRASIAAVLPDEAVRRTLKDYRSRGGKTVLVAAGKAAWQMARAALETLGGVDGGVVITKYGHVKGPLPGLVCCEAGHPVPDENSFDATKRALELVKELGAEDTVIFLLSGGGSALFELPLIPGEELRELTRRRACRGRKIRPAAFGKRPCPSPPGDGKGAEQCRDPSERLGPRAVRRRGRRRAGAGL